MRVDVAESVLTLGTERPWGDKPMPATWVDAARKARGSAAEQAEAVGVKASGEVEEVGPFGIKMDKVKGTDGEDELEVKVQITNAQIVGGVVVAAVLGYFIAGNMKQTAGGGLEEDSSRSTPQSRSTPPQIATSPQTTPAPTLKIGSL